MGILKGLVIKSHFNIHGIALNERADCNGEDFNESLIHTESFELTLFLGHLT